MSERAKMVDLLQNYVSRRRALVRRGKLPKWTAFTAGMPMADLKECLSAAKLDAKKRKYERK